MRGSVGESTGQYCQTAHPRGRDSATEQSRMPLDAQIRPLLRAGYGSDSSTSGRCWDGQGPGAFPAGREPRFIQHRLGATL